METVGYIGVIGLIVSTAALASVIAWGASLIREANILKKSNAIPKTVVTIRYFEPFLASAKPPAWRHELHVEGQHKSVAH